MRMIPEARVISSQPSFPVTEMLLCAPDTREGTEPPQESSTIPCEPSAERTIALMVSCGARMDLASEACAETVVNGLGRMSRSAAIVCCSCRYVRAKGWRAEVEQKVGKSGEQDVDESRG